MANTVITEEKQAHIQALEKELEGLFRYYGEAMCEKVCVELSQCGGSRNAVVAALMEESDLPLSRLVDEIHDKLNKEVANGAIVLAEPVTTASVKGSILFVGQRMMYGVPNADADMLEDSSQSCLWCWETRDVKLFPKSVRGQLVVRRTFRRRIHERITAVSEMIASLKKLVSEPNCDHDLIKASAKLSKAYSEADIRSLVDGLLQKNSEDMAKKKANQEDKMLINQLETDIREAEKEKESLHNELQRETVLSESNSKLLKAVARNDEKCGEKREQQKQVEEAEKDQKRREKEAELKEKRLQKQVSIMKRFLKRRKINPSIQNDIVSTKSSASDSSSIKSESVFESATLTMDNTLASSSDVTLEDLRKSHIFPKQFRLNAKNYFLNYPRCSLSKEEVLAQLQSLNTPTSKKFIRVCRELHENGEPHLHALIQFEGRYQCTNPRFFDLICPSRSTHFHPNIQLTKSASDVKAYVEKVGKFIDFGVFQIDGRSSRGDKQYVQESDSKLLKGEARNDEKCGEKREQQQKQVKEAEKDQRRREKEAKLKNKRLQKQVSIMERLLKRSKINPSIQNDKVSTKSYASDSSSIKSESVSELASLTMDNTLASSSDVTLEDLRKSHIFPKRFRLNAKNYFLNYPRCSLSKEEALAQLQSLNTPTSKKFIRVCRDFHENGEPHLHALIQFDGRYQCTNPRFFDLICPSRSTHFHPNIQATKSASDVKAYVEKVGEFIDFGVFQIDGRSSRGDKQYVHVYPFNDDNLSNDYTKENVIS